jgi:hypothetical protein
MGNLRSLKWEPEVTPYGAKRRILWLWICTFAAWSENGHPYMARNLWSWDLAMPGIRTGFLEARSGFSGSRPSQTRLTGALNTPVEKPGLVPQQACTIPIVEHTKPQ